jgi:hypothetical protein
MSTARRPWRPLRSNSPATSNLASSAFTDVRVEAPGLPLLLTRSYDSRRRDILGDFGSGWSASGQDIAMRKNMVLGLE